MCLWTLWYQLGGGMVLRVVLFNHQSNHPNYGYVIFIAFFGVFLYLLYIPYRWHRESERVSDSYPKLLYSSWVFGWWYRKACDKSIISSMRTEDDMKCHLKKEATHRQKQMSVARLYHCGPLNVCLVCDLGSRLFKCERNTAFNVCFCCMSGVRVSRMCVLSQACSGSLTCVWATVNGGGLKSTMSATVCMMTMIMYANMYSIQALWYSKDLFIVSSSFSFSFTSLSLSAVQLLREKKYIGKLFPYIEQVSQPYVE